MGAHNRKNRSEGNLDLKKDLIYRAFLNAPEKPLKQNIEEDHKKNNPQKKVDRSILSDYVSNCKKYGREVADEMHNSSRLNFDLSDLEDALRKMALEKSGKFNKIGRNLQVYYHKKEERPEPKLKIIIEGSKGCIIDSSVFQALTKYNLILEEDKDLSLKAKINSFEKRNFNFIYEKWFESYVTEFNENELDSKYFGEIYKRTSANIMHEISSYLVPKVLEFYNKFDAAHLVGVVLKPDDGYSEIKLKIEAIHHAIGESSWWQFIYERDADLACQILFVDILIAQVKIDGKRITDQLPAEQVEEYYQNKLLFNIDFAAIDTLFHVLPYYFPRNLLTSSLIKSSLAAFNNLNVCKRPIEDFFTDSPITDYIRSLHVDPTLFTIHEILKKLNIENIELKIINGRQELFEPLNDQEEVVWSATEPKVALLKREITKSYKEVI